jgi:fucose permease
MPSLLLLLAYLGFISLGLPDATLGLVWPSLRATFGLPQSAMGLMLGAGTFGYLISSLNAGVLIKRMGVGNLLALSTGLMTAALTGYSVVTVWPLYLLCGVIAGFGSGAIDSGLNAYAANHFSGRHMTWLHAFYSVGATLGPIVVTAVLTAGLLWRWSLGALALCMSLMGLAFTFTRQLWNDSPQLTAQPGDRRDLRGVLSQLPAWLQIATFFVYTGIEVTAGQWSFTLLTESRQVDVTSAGLWVGVYWGSLTLGRFVFGTIVERVGMDRLLRWSMLGVISGAILIALPGWPPLAALGLAVLGFSLAPIFPCLMSQTPGRFGALNSPHLVGFQTTAATLGVLTFPSLAGVLAERISLEAISVQIVTMTVTLLLSHEALLARLKRPIQSASL